MFSSWEISWWYFHTISHTSWHTLTPFHPFYTNFSYTYFLFWPFFSPFLHVGCLKASTQAVKFNGDTLKYFHTLAHTLHTIFTHFGLLWQNFVPISTCWVCKSLYSSWAIQWWYFHTFLHTLIHTLSNASSHTFTHSSHTFHTLWASLAN